MRDTSIELIGRALVCEPLSGQVEGRKRTTAVEQYIYLGNRRGIITNGCNVYNRVTTVDAKILAGAITRKRTQL